MPKTDLLNTTAATSFAIQKMTMKPTPAERIMGRFMRAPDGHEGGDGGAGDGAGAGDDNGDAAGQGADAGADSDGADGSVLGDAKSDAGAGSEGADGQANGSGGDADDGKDGPGDGPPEAYDLKLTVTEKDADGNDVETAVDMDPVLVEKAAPVLKGLKLNNDQANELVKLVPEVQTRMLQQQADEHKAMAAAWAREAEADKEIGGKNWKETQSLAAKALDHFGAPEGSDFRKLLNETGLGNHPTMIAMFRKVGASIKEDDKLEGRDTNPQGKKDKLEVLYPDDQPTKK